MDQTLSVETGSPELMARLEDVLLKKEFHLVPEDTSGTKLKSKEYMKRYLIGFPGVPHASVTLAWRE